MLHLGCQGEDEESNREDEKDENLELLTKDTLTVGSEIPFPPFEEGEPPDYAGFDIDLINAVADELALDTEIKDVPLSQILEGDPNGLDLSISAVKITPAREKRVDFSHPYYFDQVSLLVPEDGQVESLDDLTSSSVVGVEDGTSAEEFARRETPATDIRAFSSAGEASAALLDSAVDAVLASGSAAQETVESRPGVVIADTYPTRDAYGVVLPGNADELRKAVNEALEELEENGTLAGLYDKYFGVEPPAGIAMPVRGPR